MNVRTRRVLEGLALIVAVLFLGRWTAEFVTEYWWADRVAPSAAAFVTDYALLGIGLDALAVVGASVWFAMHALIVARAISSVQVNRRIGDLQLREAVPTRLLLWGAVASGGLLGLIAGAGAHAWRDPVMLAWQGVHYGVRDPLLHEDVGVLVAQLPVWDLAHDFAILLVLLGTTFATTLYVGIGAISVNRREITIHADARRHLGALMACIAAVIALGYALAPYHLAASHSPELSANAALLRVRAANIMAGVSLVAVAASILWGLRGRTPVLVAGWLVIAFGALGERAVVPTPGDTTTNTSSRLATLRHLDAIAWGIREAQPFMPPDTLPSVTALWDEPLLNRLLERTGGRLIGATASPVIARGHAVPAWIVASPDVADSTRLDVMAIADGSVTATGNAAFLYPGDSTGGARPIWRSVSDARVRPDAAPWVHVRDGVSSTNAIRRLLVAWARQAPGMIPEQGIGGFDWHLNPLERAAAVLPMIDWVHADLALADGQLRWIVQGMLPIEGFPTTLRQQYRGAEIAGLVPAVVAVVDVSSGAIRFHSDPAADSLGLAWAHAIGPLVEPAARLSPGLLESLTYPAEWLAAQAAVLRTAAWNSGHEIRLRDGDGVPAPLWVNGLTPAQQFLLGDPAGSTAAMIATAYRVRGIPQLRIDRPEQLVGERSDARQVWLHLPAITRLHDSVVAAGDSVGFRAPRWYAGHEILSAWQPVFAIPRRTAPVLLRVQTVIGDVVGGGRFPADAWATAQRLADSPAERGPDQGTILESAREWVGRADSALRRGDLTAFGRAFEALRSTLQRTPN